MKKLPRIFELTKRDQRVVVVIVIVLLAVTVAERYCHTRTQSASLMSGAVSKSPSPPEGDQVTADDEP